MRGRPVRSVRNVDVVIVGGGIAGSSLAAALAKAGLGVVVVERERRFRDRVRGESVHPWGGGSRRSSASWMPPKPAAPIRFRSGGSTSAASSARPMAGAIAPPRGCLALGPRAGQPVRRLRSAAAATATGRRPARPEGSSLHADVECPARRRD